MKNPPYHIESVTSEDEFGCTILFKAFTTCMQYATFLKAVEEGQLSAFFLFK